MGKKKDEKKKGRKGGTKVLQLDRGSFEIYQPHRADPVGIVWSDPGRAEEWWALTPYYLRPGEVCDDIAMQFTWLPSIEPPAAALKGAKAFAGWARTLLPATVPPMQHLDIHRHAGIVVTRVAPSDGEKE